MSDPETVAPATYGDPMTTMSTEGAQTVPTDAWRLGGRGGRQRMIPDETTGELHAYIRASTFSKILDDKEGLIPWKAWMAVKGAAVNAQLREAALHAERTPARVIDQLAAEGGAHDKRDRGAARHQILAMALHGYPLPDLTPENRGELDKILRLIDSLGTVAAVEAPNVNDEYRVAGTVDLVIAGHDHRTVVADFKTGSRHAHLSTAIQLVCYARARYWDFASERRLAAIAPSEPRLVAIHPPQDGAEPRIIDIDPQAAKRWAQLALWVREARAQAALEAARA